jgi:hypothetical protein
MDKELHADTVQAALDLLDCWQITSNGHIDSALNNFLASYAGPDKVKLFKRAVQDADFIEDVTIPNRITDAIMDIFSRPTRFQHFAYSGAFGEMLKCGKTVVPLYGGYNWNTDVDLGWIEGLGDVSWANVGYNKNCGFFDEAFLDDSPGAKCISGKTDWDEQTYPSAIKMASFYGIKATAIYHHEQNWDIVSLGFALHFLHDLTIPHHTLYTLMHDHSDYEKKLSLNWRQIYSKRSEAKQSEVIKEQLKTDVAEQLDRENLGEITDFEALAKRTTDITCQRIKGTNGFKYDLSHPSKPETLSLCALAVAVTIQAFRIFGMGLNE